MDCIGQFATFSDFYDARKGVRRGNDKILINDLDISEQDLVLVDASLNQFRDRHSRQMRAAWEMHAIHLLKSFSEEERQKLVEAGLV